MIVIQAGPRLIRACLGMNLCVIIHRGNETAKPQIKPDRAPFQLVFLVKIPKIKVPATGAANKPMMDRK
ncbi:Uncharacterised protein [Mesomycoplasma hyorhinis]|nr:Uncharacterised protein [Mesomycoplasma hyorhinis]